MVNNDDTGFELLNKEQLKNYFRIKDLDKNCQKLIDEKVNGVANAQSLSFLTKVVPWEKRKPTFIKVNIPKNIDILPQTMKKVEEPDPQSFLLRNLLFFPTFDQENREIYKKDLDKYDVWKKNEVKEINEFGIIKKSEEEKDQEFNIQLKILESRNKQFHEETSDERKGKLIEQLLALDQKPATKANATQAAAGKKKAGKKTKQASISKAAEVLETSKDSIKSKR